MFLKLFCKKYLYIFIFFVSLYPFTSFGAYVPFGTTFSKSLTAEAVYVGRIYDSGTIESVFEKSSNEPLPIASLTKVITALVAVENIPLDTIIPVTRTILNTEGSMGHLSTGKKYTLKEILKPLIVASSNDAAEAIAQYKNRNDFIDSMYKKANDLGLLGSVFYSPSGLDDLKTDKPNTMSAKSMSVLFAYVYQKEPDLFDYFTLRTYKDPNSTMDKNFVFKATNRLYRIPAQNSYVLGSKTGSTQKARSALVFIVKHKSLKNEYVVTMLRSRSLYVDAIKIINEIKKYDKNIK